MISYSIAIRTLGMSGEKYKKLLNSINNLTDKPEKVIVVLPEGYDEPKEKLGYEQFVYCKKSMILQRIEALKYIESEYVLFCDDDVEFEKNFIDKLYQPLKSNTYVCSAGPLLEFFPPNNIKYKVASILGGACVMLKGKKTNYVKILKNGGWSYNHDIDQDHHKIYDTESLPWTCFFINTNIAKEVHMEDELWIEKKGYAAFDDRVMFYKLIKQGYKICVVSDAKYKHNDAKTSVRNLSLEPLYARYFNHIVFWHRFIYSLQKNNIQKLYCILCVLYYIVIQLIYELCLVIIKRHQFICLKTFFQAVKEAIDFIHSQEYKSLNCIRRK